MNQFTDRQKQVVVLVAFGYGHKEIGKILGISIKTVDKHLSLSGRTLDGHPCLPIRLARYVIQQGWVSFETWLEATYVHPDVLPKNWAELWLL
jgi:DNA-binding NarL/FixJ family response regulator